MTKAWNPYLVKDIELLEGVQHRATKLVKQCRNWDYENRLKYLGLTTLVTRRIRGDMIQTFKIFKGFDNLDPQMFFKMCENNTRGHQLKIFNMSRGVSYQRRVGTSFQIGWWRFGTSFQTGWWEVEL